MQKEIELTEYEHKRLNELQGVLDQVERGIKDTEAQLLKLGNYRIELYGRKAELVELLADKYDFDPLTRFHIDTFPRVILEVDNNGK